MTMSIIDLPRAQTDQKKAIREAFMRTQRSLPSWLFYDEIGSELFCRITEQDEYYLTRTELSILQKNAGALVEYIEADSLSIIELGAGDGTKSFLLLNEFRRSFGDLTYYPIDISASSNERLVHDCSRHLPWLSGAAVNAHYLDGLKHLAGAHAKPWLLLFLGSNLGNFSTEAAEQFLKELRSCIKLGDYLLIGLDLKKDPEKMLRAYSDSAGVTAEFNLNLLDRLNNQFSCYFDRDKFKHYAMYNAKIGAMESYLISQSEQEVSLFGETNVLIEEFESIQTETSCKYTARQINAMAENAGFDVVHHFTDENQFFVNSLWQAKN